MVVEQVIDPRDDRQVAGHLIAHMRVHNEERIEGAPETMPVFLKFGLEYPIE